MSALTCGGEEKKENKRLAFLIPLAEVAGFEPTNNGVKARCLATWRHLNITETISRLPKPSTAPYPVPIKISSPTHKSIGDSIHTAS